MYKSNQRGENCFFFIQISLLMVLMQLQTSVVLTEDSKVLKAEQQYNRLPTVLANEKLLLRHNQTSSVHESETTEQFLRFNKRIKRSKKKRKRYQKRPKTCLCNRENLDKDCTNGKHKESSKQRRRSSKIGCIDLCDTYLNSCSLNTDVLTSYYQKLRNTSISYVRTYGEPRARDWSYKGKQVPITYFGGKGSKEKRRRRKYCYCLHRQINLRDTEKPDKIRFFSGSLEIDCDFLCAVNKDEEKKKIITSPVNSTLIDLKKKIIYPLVNSTLIGGLFEKSSLKGTTVVTHITKQSDSKSYNYSTVTPVGGATRNNSKDAADQNSRYQTIMYSTLIACTVSTTVIISILVLYKCRLHSKVLNQYRKMKLQKPQQESYLTPTYRKHLTYLTQDVYATDNVYAEPVAYLDEVSLEMNLSDFENVITDEYPYYYTNRNGKTDTDHNNSSHTVPEGRPLSNYIRKKSHDENKVEKIDELNKVTQPTYYETLDGCAIEDGRLLAFSNSKGNNDRINDLKYVPKSVPKKTESYKLLPEKHGTSGYPIKFSLNVPVNNQVYSMSDKHSESKNELPITIEFVEECFSYEPESIVAVKPLKTGDDIPKQNDPSKQIVKKRDLDKLHEENEGDTLDIDHTQKSLDWDKIIRFLVQKIPPQEWKLFFNCLFDHAKHLIPLGMSIDNKISQIESDVKVRWGGVSTLMFELFKYWKEVMGTEVNTFYIYRALTDMSFNTTAAEFQEFLRCLPLKPVSIEKYNGLRMATTLTTGNKMIEYGQRCMDVFALHNKTETLKINDESNRLQVSRRESNEVALQIGSNSLPYSERNFPALPGTSGCHTFPVKTRKRSKTQKLNKNETSSDSDTESIPCKQQKLSYNKLRPNKRGVLKPKRKNNSDSICEDIVQWEQVDKESLIIDMIKRLLELDQNLDCLQYDLYVKYVLSLIIEKTNTSENVILSVQYMDYENVQKIGGRYKHVTYILDTEDARLHLYNKEWESLTLYAEKAREKIVCRLKSEKGDTVLPSKYLFIRYHGEAFIEEHGDGTRDSASSESQKSGFSLAKYEGSTDNTELRGTFQTENKSTKRIKTPEEEMMVGTTKITKNQSEESEDEDAKPKLQAKCLNLHLPKRNYDRNCDPDISTRRKSI